MPRNDRFHSPCSPSKRFALGGATFSGLLAVSACFLVGCCGSPMLVVWINIFGAAFNPFAKPFIALLTTATIAAAWVWMSRRRGESTGRCGIVPAFGTGEQGGTEMTIRDEKIKAVENVHLTGLQPLFAGSGIQQLQSGHGHAAGDGGIRDRAS